MTRLDARRLANCGKDAQNAPRLSDGGVGTFGDLPAMLVVGSLEGGRGHSRQGRRFGHAGARAINGCDVAPSTSTCDVAGARRPCCS